MTWETAVPVASGGMGEVFKAWDPSLERHVALKYILWKDPVLVERLLREARAQARIDHPNICKVYGVGEDDGRAYIAMQFIDGRPLHQAAGEMSVEEKVALVRTVAEAMHEAHTLGIIHRDLKPGNILVERSEDGGWKPYVVDFGLARCHEAPGLTRTGEVMGTPAYMAPEQVRGETGRLDRRTDLYALGAVLYQLLGGRPPFEGDSSIAVLVKVVEQEPVSLRRLDPAIPVDLEVIVGKCLEKEPHRRYDSTRALAEDLGRYLAGEPILARAVGWPARLARRARRNPLVAAALATATVVTALAGGLAVRAQLSATARARAAQAFGQEIERIDTVLRTAYMAPLHDVRRVRDAVRQRMAWIEAEMAHLGGLAEGPGRYALGKGHLDLGEPREAHEHLQRAWQSGYREPEVAVALGQVLGVLYQREIEQARAIRDDRLREARVAEIEADLRDPALASLRIGRPTRPDERELVEAQIAFYDGRLDEALAMAEAVFLEAPWLYEARLLAGDALRVTANQRRRDGDFEAAMTWFQRAEALYREAAEVGRSDPSTHLALCSLSAEVMEAVFFDRGGEVRPWFELADADCGRALQADPGSADSLVRLSTANLLLARHLISRGEDAAGSLEEALRLGQAAVKAAPADERAHRALGDAQLYHGDHLTRHGEDAWDALTRAIACYERAIELNPDYVNAYNSLGTAYVDRITLARARGLDPGPSFASAVGVFERALELLPSYTHAHNNLGILYRLRGEHELATGKDPLPSLALAAESYRRAIESNPGYSYAHNNLGNVYRDRAEYEMTHGLDPRAALAEAQRCYARATELNPDWAFPYLNSGLVEGLSAEHLRLVGLDPTEALNGAVSNLERGLEILGGHPVAWVELARVHLVAVAWDLDQERSPEPALTLARRAIHESLSLDPGLGEAHRMLGTAELAAARYELRRHGRPQARLDTAAAALDRALQANSSDAMAWLERARLEGLRAESEPALPAAERAELYAQGEHLARRALEVKPDMAAALVVAAELLLGQARASRDPEARTRLVQAALADLARAAAINPTMERRLRALREEALALAPANGEGA